jgi:Tol biopolymer transport system component
VLGALVGVLTFALAAANAAATHSLKDQISTGPTGGNGAFASTFDFSSGDGSKAIFETQESLVAGDTDAEFDLYQRQGGTTSLISTGPAGGNGPFEVFGLGISNDGSRVFFETDESLVAGDTDGLFDTYQRSGGTTTLISTGPTGGNGPFDVFYHANSRDGAHVIFETDEQLVAADTDSTTDIYDRAGGTTSLVSIGPTGGNGATFLVGFGGISDDGTRVFFETDEKLVAGDTDARVDIYERSGGTTTLVSTGPAGGNGALDSIFRATSQSGARVFFQTQESLVAGDTDTRVDVYERSGGTTTQVSTGPAGGNGAFDATYDGSSGDGTRVFFDTKEVLTADDTDAQFDLYQRSGGTTTRLSTGPTGGNGPFDASYAGSSLDGARVFIETREPLVATDTDTSQDIYERSGGSTAQVSTGPAGGNGAADAFLAGASLDGARVFFETSESLVATDTDVCTGGGCSDVYERFAGATTHISFGPTGGNGAIAALFSGVSDDGSRVFFDTRESLMASDTDTVRDIYVADVAGYPRPKGATPMYASLVPAYNQCTSPNRTHGPPLASGSCNPPAQSSGQLTVGSPDVAGNGQAANAVGFAKYDVIPGVAGGADDADVKFTFSFTDVRRQGTLADYTGQLQATTTVQITDRLNGPAADEPATGSVDFPITVPCATTGDTTVGSTCSILTSFDAVNPGAVTEIKRSIWQLDRIRVNDGGADGLVSTTPNTLFATQGVFVP